MIPIKDDDISRISQEVKSKGNYWERFLRRNNVQDITKIQTDYPRSRVVTIDVSKILNMEVRDKVIARPGAEEDEILAAFAESILPPREGGYPEIRIRWVNVENKKKIKYLRSVDERKLTSIKGLVKRASAVRPKVVEAYFKCPLGHFTRVSSIRNDVIQPPRECSICKSKSFDHVDLRDVKVDRQWVIIQDPLEDMTDTGEPSSLKCEVIDDLCGICMAGDRVVIDGIYRSVPIYKAGQLTASKDIYFDVRGIEMDERDFDEVDITEEEEKELIGLSKDPFIYQKLINSIAPSILGMELLKEAIILQLFEGVTKVLKDGTINRGHINVLCVSDPGMAKTKLLRFVAKAAPRGVFVTATTSTKVGLVAPIVRDEITGEYTVQAGAYMIANGGILCIDEVGELTKEDFKYMNEAMEDGEAHITKGGLNITVKTRASQLAACNPIEGSFDQYRPLAEQVKIPESTLSRYDLKILLTDKSSEEKDRAVMSHITAYHMSTSEWEGEASRMVPSLLRKYISLGRRVVPVLSPEAAKIIDEYYVKVRKEGGNGDRMKITPRQGTACIRLAESHAKMRLSETVTIEDAEAAIDLFDICFRNLNTDPITGKIDMARSDHKATRESILSALYRVLNEAPKNIGISESDLINQLHKYDTVKVLKVVEELKKDGKIIERKAGRYELVK